MIFAFFSHHKVLTLKISAHFYDIVDPNAIVAIFIVAKYTSDRKQIHKALSSFYCYDSAVVLPV